MKSTIYCNFLQCQYGEKIYTKILVKFLQFDFKNRMHDN